MSRRRAGVVGAAVLALALTGGTAAAVVRHRGHSDASPTFSAASTAYPQQTVADAIRDTLAGLDTNWFLDVRLQQQLGADGSADTSVAPGMLVDIKAPSEDSGAGIPALWEAEVAEGAIAERIAGDSPDFQDVVGNLDTTLTFPDGATDDVGGGAGYVTAGELFGAQASGESDSKIEQDVDATLASYDLQPDQVRVLHPLGPAVWVVATTNDPSQFPGRFDEIQNAIMGIAPDIEYEGLYLEIDNAQGEPLMRVGNAIRNGGGVSWTSPSLQGSDSP
jgi:hypothetical protein